MDDEEINEMNGLLKKIKDFELKPYDLENFSKFLESKIESVKRKAKPGFVKVNNDDVEWLKLYSFFLKKLEARDRGEPFNLFNQEWQQIGAKFEKIKRAIDDFETYGIIDKAQWSIGGGCWYNIIDKTSFQNYIFKEIKRIINKIDYSSEINKSNDIIEITEYPYDVALSFAGEDRSYSSQLAIFLMQHNVKVFYDAYEASNLWGKDLYEHLSWVYKDAARYCVMFISKDYANKAWTTHERKQAQARAFQERQEYILPLRIDDTSIPGLPDTIGYLDLRKKTIEEIGKLLLEKLDLKNKNRR